MPRTNTRRREAAPKAGWFGSTSWTAVLTAGQSTSPQAGQALAKLCQTYWAPLYAYVRQLGHNEHDAKDLTQQFFFVLLSKNYLGAANRAKGKFRSFLLTALHHFLANEWDRTNAKRRGGGQRLVSLDAPVEEGGHNPEPASNLSPLKLFEQHWARTVFAEALEKVRGEYAAAGKAQLFEHAKQFLEEKTGRCEYTRVAAELQMSTGAVAMAVHRLRDRFADLVRTEVAHTLANPTSTEIDQELNHLYEVFST